MTYPTHKTHWAESAKGSQWRCENGNVLVFDYVHTANFPNLLWVTRTTLRRMVREGRFPAPHKLGPNTTAWRCGDVLSYLAGGK